MEVQTLRREGTGALAHVERYFFIENSLYDGQDLPIRVLAADNGLSAVRNGKVLLGGSMKYIAGQTSPDKAVLDNAEALADKGSTPLLFAESGASGEDIFGEPGK